MNKVFLFDLGNVLAYPIDNKNLYNKLHCQINYDEFLKYWWTDDLVIKAHMGLISDDEHIESLLAFCKSDLTTDKFYEIYDNLDKSLYKDTIEIINNLKKKKYKVGLLSNLRLMDYNRYKKAAKKLNFDYLFLSFEMQSLKPQKEIYLEVIDKLHCTGNEIVFFDDNEKNVNAAKSVGINAYKVTGENIKEVFKSNFNI